MFSERVDKLTPPHGTTFNAETAETAELAEQNQYSLRVLR
jgi:hypothetical protein